MKALVKVGYRCNQGCRFCHRQGLERIEASREELEARVDRAARLGHSMVVFSGGEATLRPELPELAARVAARGLDLGLVSNGSLLDAAMVERLGRHRLRWVQISLHGGSAEVHDALVRAESFDRVLGALEALSGRGLEVWVNAVVTRQNLERLEEIPEALAPFPEVGLKLSLVEPRGGAERDFEELVPRVSEAAPAVLAALRAARAAAPGRRLAHDGLPLCLLPGWESDRGDLRAHGFWTMAEPGEPDLFPVDERNAVQPPRCRPCALSGRCPGLFAEYHRRRGDAELAPVEGRPRSNSFNYVYEGRLLGGDGRTCPVEALGVPPWDPGRHLFVRNGERLGRFHTDTRDFSDARILEVKRLAGQVYLDASRGDAPDDFARQLVKLRRADRCHGCRHDAACTGIYVPVPDNVFRRDDARVLELLASLRGDVLDLGCGEGPYAQALAAADRIRYTGVEPDPARAAAMRARWPWARVLPARAEEAALDGERFDHLLVLRSWNHLADPAAALRRLRPALRPGGTLTVVDNEAFGLARTRPHAARAERSAAGFEHFRNDGAAEAHRTVEGLGAGLRLEERRDVGPETSNQWLLRYRAT